MNNSKSSENSGPTRHNILLMLLLVLASVAGTAKDLDRLREFAGGFESWISSLVHIGTTSVCASGLSPGERTYPISLTQNEKLDQFRWSGRLAPAQSVEIKGINGDINAESAGGNEIEVTAIKAGRRSDPALVNIKVVEHANGVTICAVYPSDDLSLPNTCEPGQGNGRMNVRNNDVKVTFKVRMPAGVGFIGQTVNGEISALSLGGNVESHTVNGSINISTTGYARAKTVNGEIAAKLGDKNWPDSLDFKTVNGGITLDLPPAINTRVEAETLNGDISSDFPLTVMGRTSRRHISGTIGGGGRELTLKTVNGDIHLRRAG